MRYIDMQENRKHGTAEFPLVYYVEVHSRYYSMPYHWHAECELIYLCSGTLNLSVDGKIYKLDK